MSGAITAGLGSLMTYLEEERQLGSKMLLDFGTEELGKALEAGLQAFTGSLERGGAVGMSAHPGQRYKKSNLRNVTE